MKKLTLCNVANLNLTKKNFTSRKIMKYVLFLLPLLTSCSYINHALGLKDDNVVEELVEAGIKYELNVDVDLTPDSKE